MKKTSFKKTKVVSGKVCDVCNREVAADDLEFEEFWSIDRTCGFASVFGDGAHISLDLCQTCIKEKLGEWIQVTEVKL